MIIELLQKQDKEAVCSLLKQCFPTTKVKDDINFEAIDLTHNIVIVAKQEKQVIGHIWIQKQYDIYKQVFYFYLMYICVDERYRRHGVATAMLKYVEALKETHHISYITFTSGNQRIEAQNLYRKLCYEKKDSSIFIKL